MLSLNATIEGDKIVLRGLRGLERDMPKALQRTLTRAAIGTHRAAFDWLNGAGIKKLNISGGGYPVPARTGALKRLLRWLKPGESVHAAPFVVSKKNPHKKIGTRIGGGSSFKAGKLEAIVYDTAEYAEVIHQGLGSSAKFGARPFITDGFERFNRGDHLKKITEKEIEAAARKRGFKTT